MPHRIDKKLNNKSEIARRLGIDPSYVSRILNGRRTGKKAQEKLKKIEAVVKQSQKAA